MSSLPLLFFDGDNMNKDRKIEKQTKIIHRLEEENKSLLEQNKSLKKMLDDNQKIIEEAERCIETHNEALSSMQDISFNFCTPS